MTNASDTEAGAGGAERVTWRSFPMPAKLMLLTIVFDFIGTGLIMPFGVTYLHEVRGLSLQTTGVLLALPAIVGLLAVGPGGVLIDRAGSRVVVIGAVTLDMVGQIIMSQAHTAPAAALSLVLTGISTGVIFPAVQAMVATVMPSALRQHFFGLNFTLLNLGIGIGGVLGGVMVNVTDPASFEHIYLIDAVTFLLPLVLYVVPLRHHGGRVEHPADDASSRGSAGSVDEAAGETAGETAGASAAETGGYGAVLRDTTMRLLVLLGFITAFIGYAQFGVGFQAFARATAHVSTQVLGWAYAGNTAVIVLVQIVVLRYVEGRRRTRALLVMCALWALSWGILGVAGQLAASPGRATLTAALVCASAAVFGIGETFLQPTLPVMVNDLAPDHLRGRYNSTSAGSFHVAEIVGPPFAGLLIGHALAGWYTVSLVVGCAGAAAVTLAVERRLSPTVNGVSGGEPDADGEFGLEVARAKIVAE